VPSPKNASYHDKKKSTEIAKEADRDKGNTEH
jgi:hypothetical protein